MSIVKSLFVFTIIVIATVVYVVPQNTYHVQSFPVLEEAHAVLGVKELPDEEFLEECKNIHADIQDYHATCDLLHAGTSLYETTKTLLAEVQELRMYNKDLTEMCRKAEERTRTYCNK